MRVPDGGEGPRRRRRPRADLLGRMTFRDVYCAWCGRHVRQDLTFDEQGYLAPADSICEACFHRYAPNLEYPGPDS
jgi:hypothetical protein